MDTLIIAVDARFSVRHRSVTQMIANFQLLPKSFPLKAVEYRDAQHMRKGFVFLCLCFKIFYCQLMMQEHKNSKK